MDKKIGGVTLKEILENHLDWAKSRGLEGVRANLSCANLSCADLSDANLSGANLSGADLHYTNLSGANLNGADLNGADLYGANLYGADLSYADLSYADLSDADLSDANLSDADLSDADLHYTNLSGANLRDANLRYADLRDADLRDADLYGADLYGAELRDGNLSCAKNMYLPIACPEKGSFIGFKKIYYPNRGPLIIELQIPAKAKRCSATSRKCRCEYAKVLSITNLDGTDSGLRSIAHKAYDHVTIYEIGKRVKPDSFDEDRWNECPHGIHFFITRQEAVNY